MKTLPKIGEIWLFEPARRYPQENNLNDKSVISVIRWFSTILILEPKSTSIHNEEWIGVLLDHYGSPYSGHRIGFSDLFLIKFNDIAWTKVC